jgi:hypothetical protein
MRVATSSSTRRLGSAAAWPLAARAQQGHRANMPPCLIGMEACVGAHHLSRELQSLGHDARLMPARYVRGISERAEERFPRRRSDHRGGTTPDDEIRRHQDSRAARLAGVAPGSSTCKTEEPTDRRNPLATNGRTGAKDGYHNLHRLRALGAAAGACRREATL